MKWSAQIYLTSGEIKVNLKDFSCKRRLHKTESVGQTAWRLDAHTGAIRHNDEDDDDETLTWKARHCKYTSTSLLNWPRWLNTVTGNEKRLASQFISHPAHLTVVPHHQGLCPLHFPNSSVGSLCPTRIRTVKELWDRAYGFSSLVERTNVTTKAAHSPQTLQDSECWSCWCLDPWPPAQQTGTYPIIYWANRAAIFLWSFT